MVVKPTVSNNRSQLFISRPQAPRPLHPPLEGEGWHAGREAECVTGLGGSCGHGG